jgi:hypothetical protein
MAGSGTAVNRHAGESGAEIILIFWKTRDSCDIITVLRRLKTEHFVSKSMVFSLQA